MPAPNEFTRKLTESVGKEAADQMVDWMHEREVDTSDLRNQVRADFAELRQEMHAGFARVDTKFDLVDARFAAIEARFASLEKTIEAKLAAATATQLKWSVAMWIATMAFLGAMIRLPR